VIPLAGDGPGMRDVLIHGPIGRVDLEEVLDHVERAFAKRC